MRRKLGVGTTRSLRLLAVCGLLVAVWLTKGFWSRELGQSLVCAQEAGRADAILIENFDPDYLLFERAQTLHQAGLLARVFVPTHASLDGELSRVDSGFNDVMVRIARLDPPEIIPVTEVEPISLNAAIQIRAVLINKNVKSVMVLAPGFRSRRSFLVYQAVLGAAAINVSCEPVFGQVRPQDWSSTWHGIQEVAEQFLKLQYYRFYVLPHYAWRRSRT